MVDEIGTNRNNRRIYSWCLIHADVFRPPTQSLLLAVCCGTGAQLLCTTLIVVYFAFIGFMNPSQRGHLILGSIMTYCATGFVNGYVTTQLYKALQGTAWREARNAAALYFPGLCFSMFLCIDFATYVAGSSSTVPLKVIMLLLFFGGAVATPLVYLGTWVALNQRNAPVFPAPTSRIRRQVPPTTWYSTTSWPCTLVVGGLFPFGAVFVELYYILQAMWHGYYYYSLFIVTIMVLIMIAELSILLTFLQLCSEDYRWWWRSFCNGGGMAIFVAIYSVVYYLSGIHHDAGVGYSISQLDPSHSFATFIVFFGYMGLLSLGLFVMMGFVGFSVSLWFNVTIFHSINVA